MPVQRLLQNCDNNTNVLTHRLLQNDCDFTNMPTERLLQNDCININVPTQRLLQNNCDNVNNVPTQRLLQNEPVQRLLSNNYIDVNSIKCIATNFESIVGKIDELRAKVDIVNPDVIFGTETWLKPDCENVLIDIAGFNVFRKDTDEVRGGVILYIKSHLCVEPCAELNNMNVKDTLWVWIKNDYGTDNLVGVIYRKGDSDVHVNDRILEQLELATRLSNGKLLINGDFNLPNINWKENYVEDSNVSYSQMFYDKLCDLFLYQHILEPTRQRGRDTPNCLDLVITSSETNVSNIEISNPLGKADHCLLLWDYQVSMVRLAENEMYRYDYHKADYNKLRELLSDVDWSNVTVCNNVDKAWNYFHEKVLEAVHKCVPKVKITTRKKINPPWFNVKAKRCVKRKYYAWLRYKDQRSYGRYMAYVKVRNRVAKSLRKIKREYEKNLCKKIKRNSKAFYMYINSKTKAKSSVLRVKSKDGIVTSNNLETAHELNQFFQSVYVCEDDKDLIYFNDFVHCVFDKYAPEPFNFLGVPCSESINEIYFTPDDVKKLLQNVNPNKAMGPDDIHPRVLKELSEIIYFPLYCIFRQSLDIGVLPETWKVANVTPIFKKGNKLITENYRPVSLTSQVCKLCEKLVRKNIVNFLEGNDIFCEEQHGFRKGRSCLTNLLTTLEEWTELYDNGLPFDTLYLDFRKAFDSVPHARLTYKLYKYGIRGKLNVWIEDFLRGRKQSVSVNGSKSTQLRVTSGVPQGSVLGPVLFLAFINDLPSVITTKSKIFADDTKMYHPILSLIDYNCMQTDLEKLSNWSQEWLLGFNSKKCKVMHFGLKNPCYQYTMNGDVIETVKEEKDLGVLFTDKLSFSKYICNAAAKANRVLGLIKKSFNYITKESFLVLYKSYVRPHLEYCAQVWSPYLQKDIDVLEKVQRRATKIVPGLENLSYENRLLELKLTTLDKRRVRGDLIETYKILNDLENVNKDLFFHEREYIGLRGHSKMLKMSRSRLNVRKYFFSNRVIALWNSLPQHVIDAPTVNCFKNRYDKYYYNF